MSPVSASESVDSDQEGTSKIFRDTSVVKLADFVARYFQFNLRTDHRLDELIILAERAMQGVTPQGLRSNQALHGAWSLPGSAGSWSRSMLCAIILRQEELAANTSAVS